MHLKFFYLGCAESSCFVSFFSGCYGGGGGLLFLAVHGLLTAGAASVAEHRPQVRGLQYLQLTGSAVAAPGL